MNSTTNVNVE